MTPEAFCEEFEITLDQFYGRQEIKGSLWLSALSSIPAGFNPVVEDCLFLCSVESVPEGFSPTVGIALEMGNVRSLPKGFAPTVGGNLNLYRLESVPEGFAPQVERSIFIPKVKSIPDDFSPTLAGALDLASVESVPEGFAPVLGGSLNLSSLKSLPKGFAPVVGGSLNLGSLKTLAEGFAPVVGYSLWLGSLESIPEGFAPTVGGYLTLEKVKHIPAGFAPTVGNDLYLGVVNSIPDDFSPTCRRIYFRNRQKGIRDYPKPPQLLQWQDGKYISVDDIITEVVSHQGNVWRVKRIGESEVTYVVTDGEKYAHGATLEEARDDLVFKTSDRDKSYYDTWTVDKEVTFNELIECYRVITGACSLGVRRFVAERNMDREATYVIKDVIKMIGDSYGAEEFREFFQVTP